MTLLATGDQSPLNRKSLAAYLPLLGYIVFVFLIAATAYYSFRKIEALIEEGKLRDLGAITDTKVEQISAWRDSQKRMGESFANGSLLADEFDRWQDEGMPSNGYHIQQLLSELQYVNNYKNLSLLDRQGARRFSVARENLPDTEEVRLAVQAMQGRKAIFSDFRRSSGGHGIYIDLVVPLTTSEKNGRVVGAAVLVIDPYAFLYPLIQSWPTHRGSAETLLVRREGNEVLFLNELHHNKGTALSLRIPAGMPKLPAAMAVRGETGTTEGIDYRGVAVVAAMREIPGTPWFMVAKVDRAELFEPIDRLKTWATGLGFVVAIFGGGLLFFWLKGTRARQKLITMQRDAALEREMLVKHFEYLTRYASDIILVADESGGIVEANERATEAYGYTRGELLRMKLSDLRLPAEDPAILREQHGRLREEGELRYETVNRRKDGTTFPIEVNARIIEVQGTKYLHGIARDITARKHAEDALRKSEAMLLESQRIAHIGSWELDLVNNILSWSDENYRIFEIDRTRFGASYEAFLNTVHPDDRPMVNQIYTDSVKNRTPYDVVHRLLFPDSRIKYVREWCETSYDEEGRPLRSIGTTQDITAHKAAERKIHRLNNLYAAISRANGAIARIGDRGMLLHEICHIAVEYGQFSLAWIGLIDDATHTLKSVASSGAATGFLDRIDIPTDADKEEGYDPIGMAIRRNREYICNDLLSCPHALHFRENAEKHGLRAFAVYPLELEGRASGILAVYADEANYFGEELASLLSGLAADISLALDGFEREDRRRQAEQLLNQQRNFIRQVVDADPNLIFVRDAGGEFLLANRALAALHGMEPQELVGRNVAELFAEGEQLDAILRTDREVIEKRSPIEFVEYDFMKGMSRWHRVAKVPLEQPDGSVHVLGISVDITENRLAAEKLLKSAEVIEDLYDNAPCGYHSLNRDGIFVRVNNTELKWLGYSRNELVGQRTFQKMLTPASEDKFLHCFLKLREEGGVQELELDVLRRDGTVLPVLLNKTAIYDAEGNFVMSRSTMFDITTRRLAEAALRESENLFRTTVDNVPIIIWVAEVNDRQAYQGCNFFNRRWHDFTGHSREEALVRDWAAYVHPDDAKHCLDVYNESIGKMRPFKLEYRLRHQDGVYRWMMDSGVPRFTEEGDFSGYIGTCIDITEQRQFEKMRAEIEHVGRLNIAGEMASGLAHELSQPLTACNNYLDGCLRRMDENDWDREKLHRAVQLAHTQAERAGKIINHLKEMVRKQGHERILIDINLLARDVMTFLEDEIKRQGISIHMALFPVPKITACKVEIEQVLLNLCKNAIESMRSCPQRELRISTGVTDSGEIQVTVTDSGRGIPPGGMESLFNPFQSSKQDGLGLGLAICRSFVENHGGRIWADQQRELGAEFYFTLPIGADHE